MAAAAIVEDEGHQLAEGVEVGAVDDLARLAFGDDQPGPFQVGQVEAGFG